MNTIKRLLLVIALAAGSIGLLAACDSSANASDPPVKTDKVSLPPSYRFDPPVLEVPAGATVIWTNNDHFTHAVQIQGQSEHDMKPGESASIKFDQPGEYPYICTFHPNDMKGKVTVTAP